MHTEHHAGNRALFGTLRFGAMSGVYEVMIRSTGQMAKVLRYDPSNPDVAFTVRLPDGRVEFLKAAAVDMFEPVPPGQHDETAPGDARQAGLQQPLLAHSTAPRDRRAGSALCWFLQVLISCALAFGTVMLACERDSHCAPADLLGVQPPYEGNLLPFRFTLSERKQYVQLSKVIDVYDKGGQRIGYFYDLNFLFWMRFGYSDTSDRIWFEARRPSLLVRMFRMGRQLYLQRCDVGASGRHGGVFDLKEDVWKEPWWCFQNCEAVYNITRRPADPADGQHNQPVGDAVFNSTLEWLDLFLQ